MGLSSLPGREREVTEYCLGQQIVYLIVEYPEDSVVYIHVLLCS